MMQDFLISLGPLQELRVTSEKYKPGSERFDWPTLMPHASELRYLEKRQAEDQAKLVADHVFATLALSRPQFNALIIDSQREDGDVEKFGGFVRSKQTDIFGNTTYVGVLVEQSSFKSYMPYLHVLEDTLEDDPRGSEDHTR
ncbi:hypothetical protein MBLNU13_g03042t1 [Cladosporium sp. NU13]